MIAPGLDFVSNAADRPSTDVLRADIAGFAGVFERGPIFVARRIEDWGEQRTVFGWFFRLRGRRHRQAFGPLALYGFQQNGGGTAVVVRLGSRNMRSAVAAVPDPATGGTIGIIASSPGAWANGVCVSMPLRVRARVAVPVFPIAVSTLHQGDIVRLRSAAGIAFGTLVSAGGGLILSPPTALVGPFVVEVIDPVVDVTIDSSARHEIFRAQSLDPRSDRYVWTTLAAVPDPGPEWTPRIPASWLPLDNRLELAIAQQVPAASALVRAVDLKTPYSNPGARPGLWPPAPWAIKAGAGGATLVATIVGGIDAVQSVDVAAFRSAIELLAEHPLPSIVAIPDLMLPIAPDGDDCARQPDTTRLPPIVPPPAACTDSTPGSVSPTHGADTWPAPEVDEDDDVPDLGPQSEIGSVIATLQIELLTAIATEPDGPAERIGLVDPRPGIAPGDVIQDAVALSLGAARPELGALFYPWVRVLDPSRSGLSTTLVPPSGHIAGVMARTTRVGGGPSARFANEPLAGTVEAERALDYEERGRINAGQVSAVHALAGRGVFAFGARTLSFEDNPLRFVPGSRVLAFVRRMLRVVGQTLVFEPNDRFLWLRITVTIETALRELFEAGAFAGRTPAESYRVRCDEVTNPSEELLAGRVIALVDVALAVPLEFITVRIAFTRDGARVLDDIMAGGGR